MVLYFILYNNCARKINMEPHNTNFKFSFQTSYFVYNLIYAFKIFYFFGLDKMAPTNYRCFIFFKSSYSWDYSSDVRFMKNYDSRCGFETLHTYKKKGINTLTFFAKCISGALTISEYNKYHNIKYVFV